MSAPDLWADTVQTIALVIGASAAMFAWRQSRHARHGGGTNALALWSFLQSAEARQNRQTVWRAYNSNGPFVAGPNFDGPHSWNDQQVEAAGHVAQVLSVAGAFVKYNYVALDLLVDEWGPMITRLSEIVAPVVEMERDRRSNPKHNANLDWLADSCRYVNSRRR